MCWSGLSETWTKFHPNPLQHIWIEVNPTTSKQDLSTFFLPHGTTSRPDGARAAVHGLSSWLADTVTTHHLAGVDQLTLANF